MKNENILEINKNVSDKVIVVNTAAETEDYERKEFFEKLNRALAKSEEDIKYGRVHNAESVFKELREKYGY